MPRRLLNIGCGLEPHRHDDLAWGEVVNVDLVRMLGVDIVHDLDVLPWPFTNESFGAVEAYDVLEHLRDLPAAMAEIARVLVPGGKLVARVPLAGTLNHLTDPTHRRGFTEWSMDYFDPTLPFGVRAAHYSMPKFCVDEILFEGATADETFRCARRALHRDGLPLDLVKPYTHDRRPGANLTFFMTKR